VNLAVSTSFSFGAPGLTTVDRGITGKIYKDLADLKNIQKEIRQEKLKARKGLPSATIWKHD
jgi:hypothetical protein